MLGKNMPAMQWLGITMLSTKRRKERGSEKANEELKALNGRGEEQERRRESAGSRGGKRGGGMSGDRRALGTPCPQKASEEVEGESRG